MPGQQPDARIRTAPLSAKADLCPAHPDWPALSPREREIWSLGYDWGYQDAESDRDFQEEED